MLSPFPICRSSAHVHWLKPLQTAFLTARKTVLQTPATLPNSELVASFVRVQNALRMESRLEGQSAAKSH